MIEDRTVADKLAGLAGWTPVEQGLPDILDGEKTSEDVLAGFWYEDPWLRDALKWRFVSGVCHVIRVEPCWEFPDGKQWHTFGPSHNQITHWRRMPAPPARLITPNKDSNENH